MKDRYARVTSPAGFDGQATRRDYYFKTKNAARDFRLRIKRWKAEQKCPADTLLVLNPFDEIDRPKVAYTVPEILEAAQFKRLLETAEEEVPELIPFLAMAGFAGVRRIREKRSATALS
jgi:integrase